MFDGSPRLLSSTSERVTCGDDGNDSQEGRRLPERLLGPGGGHIKAPRKQMRQRHSCLHPEHLRIERAETHRAREKLDGGVGVTAHRSEKATQEPGCRQI